MSYKTILKSNIISVELKKKDVKITCHNNKSGNAVMTALTQNISIFGGEAYDIKKGLTAKDFKVEFKKKDSAETFYNSITAIVSDPSVSTEAPVSSGLDDLTNQVGSALEATTSQPAAEAPAGDDSDSNKTILIVGGAVALILVMALAIWAVKRK